MKKVILFLTIFLALGCYAQRHNNNVGANSNATTKQQTTTTKPKQQSKPKTASKPAQKPETKVPKSNSSSNSTSNSTSSTSSTTSTSYQSLRYDGNSIIFPGGSYQMVYVSGGTFNMGSSDSDAYSDEKTVHSVSVSSFYIGKTEVTQALWKAVMGNNPSNFKGDNLPVEEVSWNDCQEFIRKLNSATGKTFRLPTEAEWEFAARGGNSSRGYKYSGSNTIDNVAWYDGNSSNKTHAVGTKQANELGLYDMSGNVYEWCSDWYGNYSSSSKTNPKGPSSGSYRVLRGGSWGNVARFCRVSHRHNFNPGSRFHSLGLRLVLVP